MEFGLLKYVTDEKLVAAFISGEGACLGILYSRYSKKVYNKCWSFAKNTDESQDLAHDIFLKTFEKLSTFKGESKFSTWLFSIAHYHCIEYYRKNRKYSFADLHENYDFIDDSNDNEELERCDKKEIDVINLLTDMCETDKEMLVMKYQYGYSIKELQAVFQLSSSAVKMRLTRAKQKIEKLYDLNARFPIAG